VAGRVEALTGFELRPAALPVPTPGPEGERAEWPTA
jgi:hypothetical protein